MTVTPDSDSLLFFFCPAERWTQGARSMAGSDYSHFHPVCVTGYLGGFHPGHDSTEEATVRGHIQPQLTGGGWSQTGDG